MYEPQSGVPESNGIPCGLHLADGQHLLWVRVNTATGDVIPQF
jgi:hypothetical protein